MVPFVLIEALHDHVTAEGKTKNLLNYFGKRSKSIVLSCPPGKTSIIVSTVTC